MNIKYLACPQTRSHHSAARVIADDVRQKQTSHVQGGITLHLHWVLVVPNQKQM